jgi:hypothetical protein
LGYLPIREPDVDWAILAPPDRTGQQIAIKLVSSNPESHQRHHLDLYAEDRDAEVTRLLSMGAQRVDWNYGPDADYIVLADPDGNRFCVIQKSA